MNIGVDIKAFKNNSTGITKYIKGILDELQQIDAENRYYLFENRISDYAPANPNWRKITINSKLPGTMWLQFAVPKLVRKYEIGIFWAPEQICPVFGMPSYTKIITTIHDFTVRRFPETCQISVLLINKLFFDLTLKKSVALLPVSDYIKRELIEFYPYLESESKIIKTVSNESGFSGRTVYPTKREGFLFFPGNLEPRKNLNRLIKALEIVNSSGFDVPLHICGPKGWKNSDFHELIRSSPIKDRITHLGYISENDLREQYLKCKALIYPSVYEGFGIPVLEALKLGTPVLTSKSTVMEEIAGKNAKYFDPFDVESIAASIIDFLKNGGADINIKSLEHYNWKRSAEGLLEIFGELKPISV
jgi:glycosyltransferase involved in cell wall biosynthesis